MKKIAAAFLMATTVSVAAAQGSTPTSPATNSAIIKSIDAQAFAFTERHCSSVFAFPTRPIDKRGFDALIAKTEAKQKNSTKKKSTVKLKTQRTDENLYNASISSDFLGVGTFYSISMENAILYIYTCDLK